MRITNWRQKDEIGIENSERTIIINSSITPALYPLVLVPLSSSHRLEKAENAPWTGLQIHFKARTIISLEINLERRFQRHLEIRLNSSFGACMDSDHPQPNRKQFNRRRSRWCSKWQNKIIKYSGKLTSSWNVGRHAAAPQQHLSTSSVEVFVIQSNKVASPGKTTPVTSAWRARGWGCAGFTTSFCTSTLDGFAYGAAHEGSEGNLLCPSSSLHELRVFPCV